MTREEEGEEEKEKEREKEGEGDNSTFTAIAIEAANRTLLGSAGEHRMQARVKPPWMEQSVSESSSLYTQLVADSSKKFSAIIDSFQAKKHGSHESQTNNVGPIGTHPFTHSLL